MGHLLNRQMTISLAPLIRLIGQAEKYRQKSRISESRLAL
jgi:hypothetical protein